MGRDPRGVGHGRDRDGEARCGRPFDDASMAISMATLKITITLGEDQVEDIRRLVEAKRADSVSGFVKHAVDVALNDAAGWKRMLDEAIEHTGGPPTAEERAWVDSVLGPVKGRGRKARA